MVQFATRRAMETSKNRVCAGETVRRTLSKMPLSVLAIRRLVHWMHGPISFD